MRRLRTLRLQRFMTQQALAAKLGLPLFTVQRWEAGDRFPWPRHLQQLCEVLEVASTDLVEDDEWPTRKSVKLAA